MQTQFAEYGLWWLVVLNSAIFIVGHAHPLDRSASAPNGVMGLRRSRTGHGETSGRAFVQPDDRITSCSPFR